MQYQRLDSQVKAPSGRLVPVNARLTCLSRLSRGQIHFVLGLLVNYTAIWAAGQ